jgi:hypothetical protein
MTSAMYLPFAHPEFSIYFAEFPSYSGPLTLEVTAQRRFRPRSSSVARVGTLAT